MSETVAANAPTDWAAWRKAERTRLLALRMAMPVAERHAHAQAIARQLDAWIERLGPRLVGVYWPIRAEPNLLDWARALQARGIATALPVVIAPRTPLEFRRWRDGDHLQAGVWHIPVPAPGEPVWPDLLIAPVVGFDAQGYRLGYGGGYYDRTLATLPVPPKVIGVGYALQALPTIHPQPHDVRLDAVVTERT